MSSYKLDKMDEERHRKAKAAALRRKDEARNEEIRKKAMEYKEKTGSFDGLKWGSESSLKRIKESFKDSGRFKNLIKKLKD